MKLAHIAEALGAELHGDGDVEVDTIASLTTADKRDIACVNDEKAGRDISSCKAAALILPVGMEPDRPSVISKNTSLAFAMTLKLLRPYPVYASDVHPAAVIGKNVEIGPDAHIGPHVTIGDGAKIGNKAAILAGARIGMKCVIGADSVIFNNVTLYDGTIVGERCRIHAGAVIGSDGFGYVRLDSGERYKIPQTGIVRIEDDVEIGALCAIDRATIDATVIKKGAKLDNHVHVGHNTIIGENSVIAGCCGISGSVVIGANVMMGGMAGVADHVTIVSGTVIAAKTGVHTNITEPGVYSGHLVMKNMEFKRFLLSGQRIDKLNKKIKALEKKIGVKGENS